MVPFIETSHLDIHTSEYMGWAVEEAGKWIDGIEVQVKPYAEQYAHCALKRNGTPNVNLYLGEGAQSHRHTEGITDRDVTAVIFLPGECEGGDLWIEGDLVPYDPGTAVIFKSNREHQVLPLKSGRRVSCGIWYTPA